MLRLGIGFYRVIVLWSLPRKKINKNAFSGGGATLEERLYTPEMYLCYSVFWALLDGSLEVPQTVVAGCWV